MAVVLAPGDALSEVGSNNYDYIHNDQRFHEFPEHHQDSIEDIVERLHCYLSPESPMEMNRAAWHYLEIQSQSQDVMDNIKSAYGERRFALDVYRAYKRLLSDRVRGSLLRISIELELSCLLSSAERNAIFINEAMEGNYGDGLFFDLMYHLILTYTPFEVQQIERSYRSLFEVSLEDDIAVHTDGTLKMLVLQLLGKESGVVANIEYDVEMVDRSRLLHQAASLHQNIHMIRTSPERQITEIVTRESKEFLGAIMDIYPHLSFGRTLELDLSDVNVVGQHGSFEKAIVTIMECAKNRPKYFAKLFHKAMRDPNNIDHDAIAMIVAMRAKLDMEDIKDEYLKEYDSFLRSDVEDAFSGFDPHCKALLLSLMDWNAPNS